jgi:hypothetical protein
MNLKHSRSVKFIGATLICMAGLFTASYALAGKDGGGGGGYSDAELKNVDCKLEHKTLKVEGEVKNRSHKKDYEVKIVVKGEAKILCENPGENIVEPHTKKVDFEITDRTDVDHWGDFKARIDLKDEVADELKHKRLCPNDGWKAKIDKIEIDKIKVKLLEDWKEVDTVECHVDKWGNCDCGDGGSHH